MAEKKAAAKKTAAKKEAAPKVSKADREHFEDMSDDELNVIASQHAVSLFNEIGSAKSRDQLIADIAEAKKAEAKANA